MDEAGKYHTVQGGIGSRSQAERIRNNYSNTTAQFNGEEYKNNMGISQ